MFCTFFKKNKRIYIDRFTAKFWSVFFNPIPAKGGGVNPAQTL